MVFIGNIIKKEGSMVSKIYWLYKKNKEEVWMVYWQCKKKKEELWLVKFIGNVKIKKEEDEWRRNSLKTF